MKHTKPNPIVPAILTSLLITMSANSSAQTFDSVSWTRDNSNTPTLDVTGCGSAPDVTTDSSVTLSFELDGCDSDDTQRQEFLYERRTGIHAMVGSFYFTAPDFEGGISIAQTHDDRTGSDGVFSIYQIRESDGIYYVMPQSDESTYNDFDWVQVYPDTSYYMDIQTYSAGDDSYERARLYQGTSASGSLIGDWQITDGSGDDEEQYKKIGAYQLTNSSGAITVVWSGVKFYTGTE